MAGQWRKIKKQNIGQNALKQSPPTHVPHFLDLFTRFFFNFRFSKKGLKQTKTIKNDHLLYIQFRSKNLTNFAANMFLIGVRKNICTAPFLDAQELHSSKTLKANVCIFLYTYPQENVCSKGILPSIKVLR